MDGFYSAYFTGTHGSGYAVLVMHDGAIAGADATGASYDGHYRFNDKTGTYDGSVLLKPRQGTTLVTGAKVDRVADVVPIPIRLPANFENGQIVRVETPAGPINVTFHKLRDLS